MNNNNFINLNQLLTSSLSMSRVRNKTIHRDDKSLSNKHMIAKMPENRSKKYVISFLHTLENKCSHCFAYQYDEKCHEKTHKSKYWHCCFDDKIFNELFTVESDFVNIKKFFDEKKKNKLRTIKTKIQRKLYNLLYNIKPDFDNFDQQRKIEINKKFQKLIVIYNNVFFFAVKSSSSIKKQHFQHISSYERNKTFVWSHVCRKKRCEKILSNLSNEFVSRYHRTSFEFKRKSEAKKIAVFNAFNEKRQFLCWNV